MDVGADTSERAEADASATRRATRGRPPLADDEETYRVFFRVNAARHDDLCALAFRLGLTRKERGAPRDVPNLSAAARRATDLLVELAAIGGLPELLAHVEGLAGSGARSRDWQALADAVRKALAYNGLEKKRTK